jgi:ATP-dependent Clp protease, protease subunit
MNGQIYINGQIGANAGEVGVNLIDIIKQVKGQPFATSFDVYINSEGGYVDVGFDIYDYLMSLKKSGVIINTIGTGLVASIATVIFMSGDSRKLKSGTSFMIHLPSGDVQGTADEIASYSQMLKDTENKLVKFYMNETGLTDEAVRPLLKQETWLDSSSAFELNFITEHEMEFNAVAKFSNINTNINTTMTNEDKNWIESQFEKFTALFKGSPKNIVLLDSTGIEIEFPDVAEGATPAVGDMALVDGQPAEGTFIMPQLSNASVTFVAGAITEIVEAGTNDEEMATLKSENESLKKQLEDAQANVTTATAKAEEVETKLGTIETEFTNFKAQVKAKFDDDKDVRKDGKKDGEVKNIAKERLEKLKTTKNNK